VIPTFLSVEVNQSQPLDLDRLTLVNGWASSLHRVFDLNLKFISLAHDPAIAVQVVLEKKLHRTLRFNPSDFVIHIHLLQCFLQRLVVQALPLHFLQEQRAQHGDHESHRVVDVVASFKGLRND
jgi:hypothetical protein